jgi:hypothetical protein
VFEPSTDIIRKGKAGKPTEFGKMVKLQEAENQIVIDYEVYDQWPSGSDLLVPAIDIHLAKLGRTPQAAARARSLPLQGHRRNATLDRPRHPRRQPHSHRPRHGKAVTPPVVSSHSIWPPRPPRRSPAGLVIVCAVDRFLQSTNLAPESS